MTRLGMLLKDWKRRGTCWILIWNVSNYFKCLDVIGPLEDIRKNIATLEFHPVKVGEFLATTDEALEKVIGKLHKNACN